MRKIKITMTDNPLILDNGNENYNKDEMNGLKGGILGIKYLKWRKLTVILNLTVF